MSLTAAGAPSTRPICPQGAANNNPGLLSRSAQPWPPGLDTPVSGPSTRPRAGPTTPRRFARSDLDGYRSAEAIRDRRRCEHDRVRIDRRAALGLAASRYGQRRTRGVQTGEARPPAKAAAGLQRRCGQQRPGAHQVNPDLPPPALGPSLLKHRQPRRGDMAGMAHVHQHVRQQRLTDVETMQPRLTPTQQPHRRSMIEINRSRDDHDGRDNRIDPTPAGLAPQAN